MSWKPRPGIVARLGRFVVVVLLPGCAGVTDGEPKVAARLLAPGIISTGSEFAVTIAPDGSALYFTRNGRIHWSERGPDGWLPAREAWFADSAWAEAYLPSGESLGEPFSYDPVISPDGSKLFIMSHGLADGRIDSRSGTDLWVLNRFGDGYRDTDWGPPRRLAEAINSPDHTDGALGIEADGTIWFFSRDRPDSFGSGDIYVSELSDGRYQPAFNVGPPFNTSNFDGHTYPAPDGSFLLFISSDRLEGHGDCDIFVSHRIGDGWGAPVNLGPAVNSDRCEITPSLGPDGRILYFSRIEDRELDIRNIYFIPLVETDFSADRG